MTDPPACNLRYRVVNAAAADAYRVGLAVDVLDEAEVVSWWDALRGRIPRRWRCRWVVLRFAEGDEAAFRRDELEQVHGV